MIALLTAFTTGFLHALEADHMAAVGTFVARRPSRTEALGFGVRWALGHSATLLVATLFLLGVGFQPSEGVGRLLEGAVGLMLVALGARLLWSTSAPRRHGTTWVGAAHGLAGTGAFLALVPVTLLDSRWLAVAYVICFGVGTVLGMGAWGLTAGVVFERVGGWLARVLTALGSVGIGLLWIVRAMG